MEWQSVMPLGGTSIRCHVQFMGLWRYVRSFEFMKAGEFMSRPYAFVHNTTPLL